MSVVLPEHPPFVLRARLLTPLADGGARWETDALVSVDAAGRIAEVRVAGAELPSDTIDVRPLVVMPGLVDTHVHIPQIPAAGLGAVEDD